MKQVEQVNKSGNLVLDYDQSLTPKEIYGVFNDLFGPVLKKDGKQLVLFNKLGILACNVSYLGHPHPLYKKRIQLKKYYLDYLEENIKKGLKTFYVGIYTYKKTRLFVVYDPSTYAAKKSHNSSAHIFTINLQYAQRTGSFFKVDHFGNKIHVYQTDEFVRYIKKQAGEFVPGKIEDILEEIRNYFAGFAKKLPTTWNGINCYKQMVLAKDRNAKQGEWPGWYFEFLFKKYLKSHKTKKLSWHAHKKKGEIDLDIKFNKPWTYGDLKADQINNDILGNSLECLDTVLRDYNGTVYYICCLYKAEKDSAHKYVTTAYWDHLRGDKYANKSEMADGYGKRMKHSVVPKLLNIIKIDSVAYEILRKNPFGQGINSDGNPRKPKLKVKKDLINALSVYSCEI